MHSDIKRFRKRLAFSILFILWGICFIHYLSSYAILAFNRTASLNGYLYLVVKNPEEIHRGDLVAFYPPPNNPFNKNDEWFVKQVVGMAGDEIIVKDRIFFINNVELGKAKESTLSGYELEALPAGTISNNKYFVWTSHKDSFDSRYKLVGLIDEKDIFGTAYLLF